MDHDPDPLLPADPGQVVKDITTEDVLQVLNPIWLTIPETASRLCGRIEAVIDAAKARGL